MSVSFGLFRKAVREPEYRLKPGGSNSRGGAVTPIGTFRRAIRVYHDKGEQAALAGISLTSDYYTRDPRGKTLADNYRDSFARYIALDAADGRSAYTAGLKQDVELAGEILGLTIDALVYGARGHTARVALWDLSLPSEAEATVIAAPLARALVEAVGEERAHSVALWHLRSGKVLELPVASAMARIGDAEEAVGRVASP
jgi:hypothetical protein